MVIKKKCEEVSAKIKNLNEKEKNGVLTGIVLIFLAIMLIIACKSLMGMFSGSEEKTQEMSATVALQGKNTESRLAEILSQVAGVGNADVMMNYHPGSNSAMVDGVIIVCDGGENAEVIVKITSTVQALLDIPAKRIKILARAKK